MLSHQPFPMIASIHSDIMQWMKARTEKNCKATYTGRRVHVFNPDPNTIVIEDISHALAMLCRYGGHTKKYYSVAEHSVILSHIVSARYAKLALMHDASEAYLGDLVRPIKNLPEFKAYRDAEERLRKMIANKFGLQPGLPKEVSDSDNNLLVTEASVMIENFDFKNPALKGFKPYTNVEFHFLPPNEAKKFFMGRFNKLFRNKNK